MRQLFFIFLLILSIFCFCQNSVTEKSIQISKASLRKLAFTECFYAKEPNYNKNKDREFAFYNLFGFDPITNENQRKPISEIINYSINWGKLNKQNLDISPLINCLELHESKELDTLIEHTFLYVDKDELERFISDPEFKYIGTYKYW